MTATTTARRLAWVPLGLALVWSVVVLTTGVTTQSWQPGYDLSVYRDGARDLLAGRDLYDRVTVRGHHFVYPPFAAVLFVPLALLPLRVGLLLWDALLVVVLVRVGGRLLRRAGVPVALVPTALALVVVSDPFREALVLGQVSPLVVLALVAGVALGGTWPRAGGLAAGFAAAVKVTPALLVVLVVERRWRRLVGWTVLVAGVATLVGLVVAPRSSLRFFLDVAWDSARVAPPGTTSNNSLAGAFAHAGVPASAAGVAGLVAALPVLALLLLAARCGGSRGAGGVGGVELGLAVSLASALVSPVSWTHHVLAAPLAACALALGGRGGARPRRGSRGWCGCCRCCSGRRWPGGSAGWRWR